MSHTLGQHVRAIRKSKGLKLKDLAEKSGLSIPYLSDTERDVVNPSLKSLQSIAKALELSLPEIVDFNDELEHRLLSENRHLRQIITGIRNLIADP